MKYVFPIAALFGFLAFMCLETTTVTTNRNLTTLTKAESAGVIGGVSDRDCGIVSICYSFTAVCNTSTQYRCNDKYQQLLYPGDWVDCNVPDTSKSICYSTLTDTCSIEYFCIWVPDTGCIWAMTDINNTYTAPQICTAL